jgi:hypothetical protein
MPNGPGHSKRYPTALGRSPGGKDVDVRPSNFIEKTVAVASDPELRPEFMVGVGNGQTTDPFSKKINIVPGSKRLRGDYLGRTSIGIMPCFETMKIVSTHMLI